jgi:L-lysine exporter family protein LysE/ArgO
MSVFFSYVLLGLSLSAPIGPINAAQLDKGIKSGFFHSWMVGVGAMAADAIYMLLVYFGVVHFIETPFLKTFLWSFGAFLLVYTGMESMRGAGHLHSEMNRNDDEAAMKSFLSGFFLSLSNPLTILFWLGIYGSVLAQTAAKHTESELLIYSFAIILGICLWDFTMASIASGTRKIATPSFLKAISLLSGLSLIGFGFYFGFQAVNLMF